MIQYTTPTITLTIDASLTGTYYVTLQQGSTEITKTGNDLTVTAGEDSTTILMPLSQEETALFSDTAPVSVQVNIVNGSQRVATNIATFKSLRNLLDEVIE